MLHSALSLLTPDPFQLIFSVLSTHASRTEHIVIALNLPNMLQIHLLLVGERLDHLHLRLLHRLLRRHL